MPGAHVLLSAPMAAERVKKGATGKPIEVEITLAADISPCRAAFRIANSHGVSNPVYIGLDELNQLPFGPGDCRDARRASRQPFRRHKAANPLSGKKRTTPCDRDRVAGWLGANFDPAITLLICARSRLPVQGKTALGGDARLETVLKTDGTYTIELHDVLYRGIAQSISAQGRRSALRGSCLSPWDGVRGREGQFELIGNIPAEQAHVRLAPSSESGDRMLPLPALPGMTGAAPLVQVGELTEVRIDKKEKGKPLVPPLAIEGRLARAGQEDRFSLQVQPGQALRFAVWAARAGARLDGVLTIENAEGKVLAQSDDSPDAVDPALDFTPPAGVQTVRVKLGGFAREGRGRLCLSSCRDSGAPAGFQFEDHGGSPPPGAVQRRAARSRGAPATLTDRFSFPCRDWPMACPPRQFFHPGRSQRCLPDAECRGRGRTGAENLPGRLGSSARRQVAHARRSSAGID